VNSWIVGILDIDVLPTSFKPQLLQCQPPLSPINVPVEEIMPCTQPNVAAPKYGTTPILQPDVVDDDLSFLEDIIVEVKIANLVIMEEDIGAPTQALRDKVFFASSVILLCCALLILVLVDNKFFLLFCTS